MKILLYSKIAEILKSILFLIILFFFFLDLSAVPALRNSCEEFSRSISPTLLVESDMEPESEEELYSDSEDSDNSEDFENGDFSPAASLVHYSEENVLTSPQRSESPIRSPISSGSDGLTSNSPPQNLTYHPGIQYITAAHWPSFLPKN